MGCGLDAIEQQPSVEWADVTSAFNGRIRTGTIINHGFIDPRRFFEAALPVFSRRIQNAIRQNMPSIKVNVIFTGFFVKPQEPNLQEPKHFSTRNYEICRYGDVQGTYGEMYNQILKDLEDFETKGSGWSLSSITSLAVNICKYHPLSASGYIDLPPCIKARKAVINVQNLDNKCFIYALLSALYKPSKSKSYLPSSYPQNYQEIFNLKGISFPVKVKDISKFENLNRDISVNVYGIEKGKVVGPLYHTKQVRQKHVNLLYLTESGRDHYCWIKDLEKLCGSQTSASGHRKFICGRSLNHFVKKSALDKHTVYCEKVDAVNMQLPETEDEKHLRFKNHHFGIRHPVVIYADFECLLEKQDDEKAFQRHTPYSVAYQVVCSIDESLSHFETYRGPNPQKWFVNRLIEETEIIEKRLSQVVPMIPLTLEEQADFEATVSCKHCSVSFAEPNVVKCRDHDHHSGRYRMALCGGCNLNFQTSSYIPVFFHNLSGYDMHFIIKELDFNDEPITLLPVTIEKYISVSKKCGKYTWRFLDSFRFLDRSLDVLAQSLTPEMFKYTSAAFPQHFELLSRKGVLCYEHLDSWAKLDETELPPQSVFRNNMKEEDISDEDYQFAMTVWDVRGIKTLGEYTDLYLQCDVKILADVFETFRDLCLKIYLVDSAHFYTSPGLAWGAALKKTNICLELLSDPDQVLFIERGIRGGLTQCSHRHAKANNKYMGEDYDPSKQDVYLTYQDCNNLYGFAMGCKLPHGGFRWLENVSVLEMEKKLKSISRKENVAYCDYTDERVAAFFEIGVDDSCILEVDLDYPEELHDAHSDLPFCPDHFVPPESKHSKLIANVHGKEKYVIHVRNLFQCLLHGLKLKKLHRALAFKQSHWLREYVELNTSLRTQAKNEFEKDFYKKMANAVFGKTMENIRKHRIIKLCTNWKSAKKLIQKPNFKSCTVFKESLIAVELNKTVLKYNKPIYLGMVILDLSKLYMYSFHYEFIRKNINGRLKLLYTDTDAFIYALHSDFYRLMKEECEKGEEGIFDTCDYPADNQFGIKRVNKKIIGKFKDELCGKIMLEFIALRAKMYSIRIHESKRIAKAKGIGKTALKSVTFEDYYEALFEGTKTSASFSTIRSIKHDVFTYKVCKRALDSKDDKRQVLEDKITTLPWGHHRKL